MLPFAGLLTWSTYVLVVAANHTVLLDDRDTPHLQHASPGELDKRCAGPGRSAYPLDLTASVPFVRFILASTEDASEEDRMKRKNTEIAIMNWSVSSSLSETLSRNCPDFLPGCTACESQILFSGNGVMDAASLSHSPLIYQNGFSCAHHPPDVLHEWTPN